MSVNGKAEMLAKLLEEHISTFDKLRKRDKDKAFWARMVQAFASAAITVLLGLNVANLGGPEIVQESLKALALVISAAATLFAAWDAFFDHSRHRSSLSAAPSDR